MARDPWTYSWEIVRDFYASYAATLRGSISKRSKPTAYDPLTSTMVRGCSVDISRATIIRFLYGPTTDHSWPLNTTEFDYRWDIERGDAFERNTEQRETITLWVDAEKQPDPTRARGKRHRSSHPSETIDDARTRIWERKEEEQARRSSILDEELHQKRALEAAAGASSSVPVRIDVSTTDGAVRVADNTTDGDVLVNAGTTEGDPSVDLVGSGYSYPSLVDRSSALFVTGFASPNPLFFTFSVHWGQLHLILLGAG
uniref:Integrase core domain containing protein n=1 Tax=Solanum tuberosum TaxID=4113 RepID=M1D8Z3_SOLTU